MIINIKINAEFGSEFQEETAKTSLKAMLVIWEDHYTRSHKKNKIEIKDDLHPKIQRKT